MSDDPKKMTPQQEEMIREYVRSKLKEIVRKKPGGGGYVLYSPNKGKKNPPKPVGEFPSKLMAKKAELSRYPPKDASKLGKLRKQIDKIQKDPKKRAAKEREWASPHKAKSHGAPKREPAKKTNEGIASLYESVASILREALFKEDDAPASQWDERIAKLSKAAMEADSKLQRLQKDIEKKTVSSLQSAVSNIAKSMKRSGVKVSGGDVKRDPARKKSYVEMNMEMDGVTVGPVYVFVEDGRLRCEISSSARTALAKLDPDDAKTLRTELLSIQEDVLDGQNEIVRSIEARDKYLGTLQDKIDSQLSGMSALEISVLKGLLVNKYRGK